MPPCGTTVPPPPPPPPSSQWPGGGGQTPRPPMPGGYKGGGKGGHPGYGHYPPPQQPQAYGYPPQQYPPQQPFGQQQFPPQQHPQYAQYAQNPQYAAQQQYQQQQYAAEQQYQQQLAAQQQQQQMMAQQAAAQQYMVQQQQMQQQQYAQYMAAQGGDPAAQAQAVVPEVAAAPATAEAPPPPPPPAVVAPPEQVGDSPMQEVASEAPPVPAEAVPPQAGEPQAAEPQAPITQAAAVADVPMEQAVETPKESEKQEEPAKPAGEAQPEPPTPAPPAATAEEKPQEPAVVAPPEPAPQAVSMPPAAQAETPAAVAAPVAEAATKPEAGLLSSLLHTIGKHLPGKSPTESAETPAATTEAPSAAPVEAPPPPRIEQADVPMAQAAETAKQEEPPKPAAVEAQPAPPVPPPPAVPPPAVQPAPVQPTPVQPAPEPAAPPVVVAPPEPAVSQPSVPPPAPPISQAPPAAPIIQADVPMEQAAETPKPAEPAKPAAVEAKPEPPTPAPPAPKAEEKPQEPAVVAPAEPVPQVVSTPPAAQAETPAAAAAAAPVVDAAPKPEASSTVAPVEAAPPPASEPSAPAQATEAPGATPPEIAAPADVVMAPAEEVPKVTEAPAAAVEPTEPVTDAAATAQVSEEASLQQDAQDVTMADAQMEHFGSVPAQEVVETPKELEENAKPITGDVRTGPVGFNVEDTTLNVVEDGSLLQSLQESGFQYLLAGACANVGLTGGRYMFEVIIVESLNFQDDVRRAMPPHPFQLLRIGVATQKSSLLLPDEHSMCFDSEGYFISGGEAERVTRRFEVGDVVSLLVNLDAESPNANTISLFCQGQRIALPKPIPESMRGQALYPSVTYRGVTLRVNFGPQPWAPIPFTCHTVSEAAVADCVERPPIRFERPEVVLAIGLPDEGLFSWLDDFQREHRGYAELSSRKLLEWAMKSGVQRHNGYGWRVCNDKPDMSSGLASLDELTVPKVVNIVGPMTPRQYVVLEVKAGLLVDGRKNILDPFPGHFRRTAKVIVGEPPPDFKQRFQDALKAEKKGEELTEEEKQSWFKKSEVPDLAEKDMYDFMLFSLPSAEAEGFDGIEYEWANSEGCQAHFQTWMQERQRTRRLDDLKPSEWFRQRLRTWSRQVEQWRHRQFIIKSSSRAIAAVAAASAEEVGESSAVTNGEAAPKAKANPEVDRELLDVFSVKNVNDVGNGEPLYRRFSLEDWELLNLRYELYLLVLAFRRDAEEQDRPDFRKAHLSFYYQLYYNKPLDCASFETASLDSLLEMVHDTVQLDFQGREIETLLAEDTPIENFIRLTEIERRRRQWRVDAGDKSVELKFPPPTIHAPPAHMLNGSGMHHPSPFHYGGKPGPMSVPPPPGPGAGTGGVVPPPPPPYGGGGHYAQGKRPYTEKGGPYGGPPGKSRKMGYDQGPKGKGGVMHPGYYGPV